MLRAAGLPKLGETVIATGEHESFSNMVDNAARDVDVMNILCVYNKDGHHLNTNYLWWMKNAYACAGYLCKTLTLVCANPM